MTDDTKAPERIWAWPWIGDASRGQWTLNASVGFNGEAQYIREDVAQTMVVAAVEDEREACDTCTDDDAVYVRRDFYDRAMNALRAILAADERGQGTAWQDAMEAARQAVDRGLDT